MKIILESEKDLNKFVAARQLGNTEVIIDGKLLVKVISGYKKEIGKLESELYVNTNNLVEDWIQTNIYAITEHEEDITEAEIRTSTIEDVKRELSIFKTEKSLSSINKMNYNFIIFLMDSLKPSATKEEIISKIEKDLSEIEVPVNAVEESVEMEAN